MNLLLSFLLGLIIASFYRRIRQHLKRRRDEERIRRHVNQYRGAIE